MMTKKSLFCLLVLLVLLAGGTAVYFGARPTYVPTLHVVGDVADCLNINRIEQIGAPQTVVSYEVKYQAVPINDLLALVQPIDEVSRLLFIADDGFATELAGDSLDTCWLAFTSDEGWCSVAPDHPVSANAKHIQRLVVVSYGAGQLTVQQYGETRQRSIGELYAGPLLRYPYPEGVAEKETNGIIYQSTIYTFRDCLTLEQLVDGQPQAARLTAEDGSTWLIRAEDESLFQLQGNSLSYINAKTRAQFDRITSIEVLGAD